MATPEIVTATPDHLEGIKDSYEYGFHDSEKDYAFKAKKGLNRRGRRGDLRPQERAAVDARVPPEGARALREPPDAEVGRRAHGRDRLPEHPLLRARLREAGPHLGRGPRRHQEHVRQARHPRGRAEVPGRRRRAVRVRGRLPPGARGPREAGRDLHGHGHGPARARGPGARVLGDGDPAERQQARGAQLGRLVGRLVRVRAAGRARRDAAAGLLPHQHGEHGPVRAHADHRRRGLVRALHRGLHGPDLHDRLAALGGRRDHLQAGLAGRATRRSRTGRTTSTTSSPSAPSRTRARRWSGSTATSARS